MIPVFAFHRALNEATVPVRIFLNLRSGSPRNPAACLLDFLLRVSWIPPNVPHQTSVRVLHRLPLRVDGMQCLVDDRSRTCRTPLDCGDCAILRSERLTLSGLPQRGSVPRDQRPMLYPTATVRQRNVLLVAGSSACRCGFSRAACGSPRHHEHSWGSVVSLSASISPERSDRAVLSAAGAVVSCRTPVPRYAVGVPRLHRMATRAASTPGAVAARHRD